ncbi:hypothetical protein FV242_32530 [Methylobacterium sp. WL64]|uniref:hypothetical protein n=1 Tax=Methylobacterium sp. WL64 TaxID=2603894 RepID=UPI0011CA09A0|nr:hypothetical protein [Methylobacterium sp. WL64]TXM97042.1 hypothetical protein FV242_32530 [Methylobacterium sp. WL64]
MFWETAAFVEPHPTGEFEEIEGSDGTTQQDTGMRAISNALTKLQSLDVIQFVPHLIDADSEEGEVIHPCPISVGVAEERAITKAARNAALRLMTDGQERYVDSKGYEPIIPLPRHLENAALVGLLRTTHRAHHCRHGEVDDKRRRLGAMGDRVQPDRGRQLTRPRTCKIKAASTVGPRSFQE